MTDVHVKNTMSYVWTKLIILHTPTSITYNVFTLLHYNVITITTFVLLIREGRLKVVQILVNGKDTDPNVVNKGGETALHIAVK